MSIGPTVRILPEIEEIRCNGCDYLESEDYGVEDGNSYDSCTYYYCKHPTFENIKFVSGYGGPKTPNWCPEIKNSSE